MKKNNQHQQHQKKVRAEQRREEAKKRQSTRTLIWVIGSVAAVALIITLLIVNQEPKPGVEVEVMKDQSHIADVNAQHEPYNSDPPTSGPHVDFIADWGVHKEEVPKEVLVHNLEDGGVVIYYNKQADEATVNQLTEIVQDYPQHVVLVPYPEMKDKIALTAWGRIDRLDAMDEERVKSFIRAFQGIDHHQR